MDLKEQSPSLPLAPPRQFRLYCYRAISTRLEPRKGHIQQGFLKLRALFAINGSCRPGVIPVLRIPTGTQIDHLCTHE